MDKAGLKPYLLEALIMLAASCAFSAPKLNSSSLSSKEGYEIGKYRP